MYRLISCVFTALCCALFSLNVFATNWSFDGSASQKYLLDDTGWKFKIALNQTVLGATGTRLDAFVSAGTATSLDFSSVMPAEVGSIIAIGDSAFRGSSVIESVTLPNTIKSIGNDAFRQCSKLVTIEPFLPDSVAEIKVNAFYLSTALKGHLKIGNNESTSIANQAFWSSSGIQEITIGNGVTSIPNTAFKTCASVTNITLGANITSIGVEAFRGCTSLERIIPFLPASVVSIGNKAFLENKKLGGTLVLGGGEEGTEDISWGSGDTFAFSQLGITNIVIGAGVTTLPAACFGGSVNVKEVNFHGYTTWASSAFHYNGTYKWNQYQSRFLVPSGNLDWTTFISDSTKVTPWDGTKLTAYQTLFGMEAEIPGGITVGDNKQYIVVKANEETGINSLSISGESTTGEALEIGEVVPAYGAYDDVTSQLPLACSAPEYVDNGNTRYRCAGYVLYTHDGIKWTNPQTNDSCSLTYDLNDNTMRRILWLWEPVAFKVSVEYPAELGTVIASASDADGFYAKGTTATFCAIPADGVSFSTWTGVDAPYPSTAATLSLVIDGEKSIVPYFSVNWKLSEGGDSISDGYWSIPVTGQSDNLRLGSCGANYSNLAILDLRKPVDGGTITAVGMYFATGSNVAIVNLRQLMLPDTLEKIEQLAFEGLSLLETITPFLPKSVTNIADRAFEYCSVLSSDLILGMDKNAYVTFSGEAHFAYNNAMRTAVMGPGVTNVPKYCFFSLANFNEITLQADEIALDEWAFHNTQVKTVKFGGTPNFGVRPFNGHANYTMCIYAPRGNSWWSEFMANPEEMTPWAELSSDLQDKYWANYPEGETPKGMTLKSVADNRFGCQWIFRWSPRNTSTVIYIR